MSACCDDSPKPSTPPGIFRRPAIRFIEGYDPRKAGDGGYVDEVFLDLGERTTPQNGRSRASIEPQGKRWQTRAQSADKESTLRVPSTGHAIVMRGGSASAASYRRVYGDYLLPYCRRLRLVTARAATGAW